MNQKTYILNSLVLGGILPMLSEKLGSYKGLYIPATQ